MVLIELLFVAEPTSARAPELVFLTGLDGA